MSKIIDWRARRQIRHIDRQTKRPGRPATQIYKPHTDSKVESRWIHEREGCKREGEGERCSRRRAKKKSRDGKVDCNPANTSSAQQSERKSGLFDGERALTFAAATRIRGTLKQESGNSKSSAEPFFLSATLVLHRGSFVSVSAPPSCVCPWRVREVKDKTSVASAQVESSHSVTPPTHPPSPTIDLDFSQCNRTANLCPVCSPRYQLPVLLLGAALLLGVACTVPVGAAAASDSNSNSGAARLHAVAAGMRMRCADRTRVSGTQLLSGNTSSSAAAPLSLLHGLPTSHWITGGAGRMSEASGAGEEAHALLRCGARCHRQYAACTWAVFTPTAPLGSCVPGVSCCVCEVC